MDTKSLQLNRVVTATINRALSCERFGALAPEVVKQEEDKTMLYRVFFSTSGAEYGRCFTDKQEAEHFYNSIKNSGCYSNVKFQIG